MAAQIPLLTQGQANLPAGVIQDGQLDVPLHLHITENGSPVDVFSLTFEIKVKGGGSVVGPITVDVINYFPTGEKFARGFYGAKWTVPDDQSPGNYEIVWSIVKKTGQTPITKTVFFDVVVAVQEAAEPSTLTGETGQYTTLDEMRGEGFDDEGRWQDDRITDKIKLASAYIEKFTGRWFEPRLRTIHVSGDATRMLLLPIAIIEVREIRFLTRATVVVSSTDVLALGDYVVYNRHLTEGLIRPDDRDNPRIAFTTAGGSPIVGQSIFPRGRLNIAVRGVFGYTDPDPDQNPFGITPLPIKDVCRKIVARELEQIERFEEREDRQRRFRITNERVGNRSISMVPDARNGPWMGDPEIDVVLLTYKRPMGMKAVGVGKPTDTHLRRPVRL